MSKVGAALEEFDAVFDEFFEDDLLVTNYEPAETTTAPDEFDDPSEKQPTADSPLSVRGQVDPATTSITGENYLRTVDADVVIFVDDEVTISDGSVDGLPYPSEVEVPDHWQTFRVSAIEPEGNGLLRCFATSTADRSAGSGSGDGGS